MNWLKRKLQHALKQPAALVVGVVFTFVAIAAIQYDETIAPKLAGIADGITGATGDLARRFG
ncbi:MAG: hypothetical protein K2P58_08625 [Hyphomonadaceae bacterium]|nr:hypothetical protein [Hyphomonadaceae bacterium]